MNQKEATYKAVVGALENAGITFNEGDNVKPSLTSQIKADIRKELFNMFRNGNIDSVSDDFKENKLNNDSELKKYVASLLSNWLRKDTRLNGGTQYSVKNPGSRAGNSDPQVREMRKLLKKVRGTPAELRVRHAIKEKLESNRGVNETVQ